MNLWGEAETDDEVAKVRKSVKPLTEETKNTGRPYTEVQIHDRPLSTNRIKRAVIARPEQTTIIGEPSVFQDPMPTEERAKRMLEEHGIPVTTGRHGLIQPSLFPDIAPGKYGFIPDKPNGDK